MLDCKETRTQQNGKPEDHFNNFDTYKSLALEMLQQISLTQLRGQAAIETLRNLVFSLECKEEPLRQQRSFSQTAFFPLAIKTSL